MSGPTPMIRIARAVAGLQRSDRLRRLANLKGKCTLNLVDLANLGEAIGGIAVLVSIVYLSVQVRHNTTAQRASAELETTRARTAWYDLNLAYPELARIF